MNFNGKQYIEIEIWGNKILQIGDIATETLVLWTRWHLLDIALPPKLLPPIFGMISPTFEITVEQVEQNARGCQIGFFSRDVDYVGNIRHLPNRIENYVCSRLSKNHCHFLIWIKSLFSDSKFPPNQSSAIVFRWEIVCLCKKPARNSAPPLISEAIMSLLRVWFNFWVSSSFLNLERKKNLWFVLITTIDRKKVELAEFKILNRHTYLEMHFIHHSTLYHD